VPVLLALFVFPADWVSGLVLLLTAPLIPIFMVLAGSAAETASRNRYAQLVRFGAAFMDALGGLVTLRQLGAAERVAGRLAGDGEEYRKLTMQVLRVAFLSALVLEFFATVSIAIVAVLVGFRLLWHELAFRQGLFVLLLAPEFYLPLRALGALRHARMDALAVAGRLAALDAHDEDTGSPCVATIPPPARSGIPPVIRFEAVGFDHPERRAVLDGCTLELPPGQVTALVGASGTGKSTLIDLLLRFATPARGGIRIDGADLARLDPVRWRERVAWVPQRPHVFEGSVRDNLLLACPAARDGAVARAAAASGLDAVIARLPQGWHTRLGEHGLGLSGGELQRLALARAFLREQAELLLLDEPTAHLDAMSATTIERVIRAQAATRTVLLVAHRLEAALHADRVVVLREGRVVEQGTPRALRAGQGAFAALLAAEAT
jgi:ATP-binding cassette subfamily C protein CydD